MGKFFSRLIPIVLLLCFAFVSISIAEDSPVLTEQETEQAEIVNLQDLTVEELLALQSEIQRVLADKGYVQYEELDRGSKGDEVLNVQERLKELGFYSGSINGKYDSETQKAFKLFEKSNGLASDGKASQADLMVLFGSSAAGKATPTPVPEKTDTVRKQEEVPDGYLPFSDFDYTEFFRYPEKYYGTKIVLKGKAVQVMGTRTRGYNIRLATSGNNDVVYIRLDYDPGFNILENDRLTVYATMRNTYTYTSTFFSEVTIPSADADSLFLN